MPVCVGRWAAGPSASCAECITCLRWAWRGVLNLLAFSTGDITQAVIEVAQWTRQEHMKVGQLQWRAAQTSHDH